MADQENKNKRSLGKSANGQCETFATDAPSSSDGASHAYLFTQKPDPAAPEIPLGNLKFQTGPVNQAGVNGVTDEMVLSVLIDHVNGFQSGPYNSAQNQQAVWHMQEALNWLRQRGAATGTPAPGIKKQ